MKRTLVAPCLTSGAVSADRPAGPSCLLAFGLLWAMAFAAVFSSPAWASSATKKLFDFESDREDLPPEGFFFESTGPGDEGKWMIVRDGEDQVLAQVDRSRHKQRLALAVVEDVVLKDVKLAVKIKSVAGEREATGGVVWRYRDAENYLLARIDVLDNRVRLYRVVNGNLATFGREDGLKLKPNTWYTLRVEHKGSTIKVYLDDEVLIVEKDRHFRDPGKVGLWTKGDAKTYFDDLRLRDPNHDD